MKAYTCNWNQKLKKTELSLAFLMKKAKQIKPVIESFYKFIESVKTEVTSKFEVEEDGPNKGKLPYEAMDKSTIDEDWFEGDGILQEEKKL